MPQTYLAYIDKVEPVSPGAGTNLHQSILIEFHCIVEANAIRLLEYQGVREGWVNLMNDTPDEVLILISTIQEIEAIITPRNIDVLELESRWCRIVTGHAGLEAESITYFSGVENLFIPNGPIVSTLIESIALLDIADRQSMALTKRFSLDEFDDASEADIKQLLNSNSAMTPELVAVYNVGQGNCNAICDSQCRPIIVFDLGGGAGAYKNRNTYPVALDFCWCNNPPIVLSHWDTDHFQTARMNPSCKAKDWIVPRQPTSKLHYQFFCSLTGTVLIYPNHVTSISFQWGELQKASGPSSKKNHSGLIMDIDLPVGGNNIRTVLLPADAAYMYVPRQPTSSWHGVAATHHGANFPNSNSPVASPNGIAAIAYSYGNGNSYGHPVAKAVNDHGAASWNIAHQKDTPGGHIGMTDVALASLVNCGNPACNIPISQVF